MQNSSATEPPESTSNVSVSTSSAVPSLSEGCLLFGDFLESKKWLLFIFIKLNLP